MVSISGFADILSFFCFVFWACHDPVHYLGVVFQPQQFAGNSDRGLLRSRLGGGHWGPYPESVGLESKTPITDYLPPNEHIHLLFQGILVAVAVAHESEALFL